MKMLKRLIIVFTCVLVLGIIVFVLSSGSKPFKDTKPSEIVSALEKPPALDVIIENVCNDTLLGTYSWQCKNNDETFTNMETDSAHPLDCADLLHQIETTETNAFLRFAEEPDTILSVCCWSDEHWSDPAADSENVSINGNEIELKVGGYIYEVTAEWNTEKSGYGGIAHYSFYVKVLE